MALLPYFTAHINGMSPLESRLFTSHRFISSILDAISAIPQNAMQCSPLIPQTTSSHHAVHIFSRQRIGAETLFSYPSRSRNAKDFTGSVTPLTACVPQKHVAYSNSGGVARTLLRFSGSSWTN